MVGGRIWSRYSNDNITHASGDEIRARRMGCEPAAIAIV